MLFDFSKKIKEKELKKYKKNDLNGVASPYKLSALHIATITGQSQIVQLLCDLPASNLNISDRHGWTPLHHAAVLGDKVSQKIFLLGKADKKAKSNNNGTYLDLVRLKTIQPISINSWDENSSSVKTLSPEEVEKVFSPFKFVDEVFMPPQLQIKNWLKLEEFEIKNSLTDPDAYQNFLKNRPSLYLKKSTQNDEGKPLDTGYGVCVNEAIKAGSVICEYVGEDVSEELELSPTESDYLLRDSTNHFNVDGEGPHHLLSYGSMIGDGFPNCVAITGAFLKGRDCRTVFVALTDLKKGDELFYNYGSHHIKWRNHQEPRPQALLSYFKENKIEDLLKKGTQDIYALSCLDYLAATPGQVLRLLLLEVIIPEDLVLLLNYFRQYQETKADSLIVYQESLIKFFNSIKQLKEFPIIRDYFLNKIQSNNVMVSHIYILVLFF